MKGKLVLALIVVACGLALAAAPAPGAAQASGTPLLSRSVTRGADLEPQRFFASDNPDETLHYDLGPSSGVGLTNGGTFYGGVRFTPASKCTIKAVLFYQWDASSNDYVFIYGEGNDTTPGAKLDSLPYTGSGSLVWKRINLTTPLVVPAGTDLWVGVRITHTAGLFPLGVDSGPCVRGRGGFISTNGTRWQQLPDVNPDLDFNWNIRAIVASVPGQAHDVGVSRIIQPGTSIPQGSYAPIARVVNFGTSPESNIPVMCWIDSAGTRVYAETTTVAGPLGPGARTEVTFTPNWATGPAGNSYDIRMFTGLGGDLDPSNDTSSQTTSIAARFALMDHDTGYCKLTVTCLGSIGYDVPPALDLGNGFRYPKTSTISSLFFSSLAIGNDVTWVADRYYSSPPSSPPNMDYRTVDSLSPVQPPQYADEHFRGSYNDSAHTTPKGLHVTQNSFMNSETGWDDFVVLIYDIGNESGTLISGLYAGIFADFDVGSNPAANFCNSDTVRRFMFTRQQTTQNPTVGIKILEPRSFANLTAIDHNIWVYPDSCVTDNQKFRFLNGTIVMRNSNRAYDWSCILSIGPFELTPRGAPQRLAVAFVGGTDTATCKANADSAQSWYDNYVAVSERPGSAARARRFGITPNPFRSAALIHYFTPIPGLVELEVYDATGRIVDRVLTPTKAGNGTLNWRPRALSTGLYFLKLKTPDRESILKVLRAE